VEVILTEDLAIPLMHGALEAPAPFSAHLQIEERKHGLLVGLFRYENKIK
jgi:hypothetical protein